jgi:hypothetical protein
MEQGQNAFCLQIITHNLTLTGKKRTLFCHNFIKTKIYFRFFRVFQIEFVPFFVWRSREEGNIKQRHSRCERCCMRCVRCERCCVRCCMRCERCVCVNVVCGQKFDLTSKIKKPRPRSDAKCQRDFKQILKTRKWTFIVRLLFSRWFFVVFWFEALVFFLLIKTFLCTKVQPIIQREVRIRSGWGKKIRFLFLTILKI